MFFIYLNSKKINIIKMLSLFRGFKQDCPDGQLGKDKILEMYSMILPVGNAQERNRIIINQKI